MNKNLIICNESIIEKVIGCAIEVHKTLGPGLLETAYELALVYELNNQELFSERQIEVPINYKGNNLGSGFRVDILVDSSLLIELKTVDMLNNVHMAQVITYLKFLNIKRGLLINFNTKLLKNGIKRISI